MAACSKNTAAVQKRQMKKMIFVWIWPDTFTIRPVEVGFCQPQPNDIPVNVGGCYAF